MKQPNAPDLRGKRFGRLLVRDRAGQTKNRNALWFCDCDCGNQARVTGHHLRKGHTRSCGCIVTKHGHAKRGHHSGEYRSWASMRLRCTTPSVRGWKYYGGRGIKVCKRWDDFGNFLADMGPKPTSKHSIDRIDSDGDYGPNNCRWATAIEQWVTRRDCPAHEARAWQPRRTGEAAHA